MATTVKLVKLPSFFLNKIVLITGASSGIGRTLSYWYLNNGAKVALVSRDAEELNNIGKQFPG
jgi:NADP-dependent 3-hydroxy acid dehydrogenase YdfG